MDVLFFAFGALCFFGLVLLLGTYFTNRMNAFWKKRLEKQKKQVEEALSQLQHDRENHRKAIEQYNKQVKEREEG